MSNVFEILKRMGGVVEENGVTYVTHPNPPANDDSQKIATTAWVKGIMDSLEASVSGGMFPTISNAVRGGYGEIRAPSGGSWWCTQLGDYTLGNGKYAGWSLLQNINSNVNDTVLKGWLCIKIA